MDKKQFIRELKHCYKNNKKLGAVKLVKEFFDIGLKESKELCDNYLEDINLLCFKATELQKQNFLPKSIAPGTLDVKTTINDSGYTDSEIEYLLKLINTEERDKGAWIILINGKRFKTSRGKSVWKAKNHASAAFNNEIARYCKNIIAMKLREQQLTSSIYSNSSYKNAYKNFMKYLIDNKIIEIKQII